MPAIVSSQPIWIGYSNLPIHDLTPVTIILLSLKRNKIVEYKKAKLDTSQILGKEEFSRRTNTRSWEGCGHAKILTKPISLVSIKPIPTTTTTNFELKQGD